MQSGKVPRGRVASRAEKYTDFKSRARRYLTLSGFSKELEKKETFPCYP